MMENSFIVKFVFICVLFSLIMCVGNVGINIINLIYKSIFFNNKNM